MISIRWRLTILLWVSIGLLLVAIGLGVFLVMKNLLTASFDETLTAKARALITASEIDDGDFEIDMTVRDFAGFGKNGRDYFEVRRSDGSKFLRSPSLQGGRELELGFFRKFQPKQGEIGEFSLGDGRNARYYIQGIYPKDDSKNRFQDLYLIVASPVAELNGQLRLLAAVLGLGGALALFLIVPLIQLALVRGLRPVAHLSEEIGKIRPDELYKRLEESALPAELVPVAAGLNRWLGRLEKSFERERRFTSDAAHELKTPLAELRTLAELGAMSAEEASPDLCATIGDVTIEMGALLENLALLASADSATHSVGGEKMALTDCVDAAVTRFRDAAAARSMTWKIDVDDCRITGDSTILQTILFNLLDNAVAYAPEGSIVEITGNIDFIQVKNFAPSLDETDLEKLFERFWRKDAARSGYGHSGLGLSIVKSFATLCGWECSAKITEKYHLQVRIRFSEVVVSENSA